MVTVFCTSYITVGNSFTVNIQVHFFVLRLQIFSGFYDNISYCNTTYFRATKGLHMCIVIEIGATPISSAFL